MHSSTPSIPLVRRSCCEAASAEHVSMVIHPPHYDQRPRSTCTGCHLLASAKQSNEPCLTNATMDIMHPSKPFARSANVAMLVMSQCSVHDPCVFFCATLVLSCKITRHACLFSGSSTTGAPRWVTHPTKCNSNPALASLADTHMCVFHATCMQRSCRI